MEAYLALRHSFQFTIINRSDINQQRLPYRFTRRVGEHACYVKNISDLVGFQLEVLCCVVVPIPRNKNHKREQDTVKQSEGIEDNCCYLVVLLQHLRRILSPRQIKPCQGERGRNRRDDEKR